MRIPEDFLDEVLDIFSEDPDPLVLSKFIKFRKTSREVGRSSAYTGRKIYIKYRFDQGAILHDGSIRAHLKTNYTGSSVSVVSQKARHL